MKKTTFTILAILFLTLFLFSCQPEVQDTTKAQVQEAENTEPVEIVELVTEEIATEEQTAEPELETQELTETTDSQAEVETQETQEPQETLINGKTAQERLNEATSQLHEEGSADHIRENFPDIELLYSDNPSDYPSDILPFDYYYSEEVDKTFNLCGVDRTVFICDGKIEETVTDEQLNTICDVTSVYLEN